MKRHAHKVHSTDAVVINNRITISLFAPTNKCNNSLTELIRPTQVLSALNLPENSVHECTYCNACAGFLAYA